MPPFAKCLPVQWSILFVESVYYEINDIDICLKQIESNICLIFYEHMSTCPHSFSKTIFTTFSLYWNFGLIQFHLNANRFHLADFGCLSEQSGSEQLIYFDPFNWDFNLNGWKFISDGERLNQLLNDKTSTVFNHLKKFQFDDYAVDFSPAFLWLVETFYFFRWIGFLLACEKC